MSAAPWATVADVYTIARKTVSDADIAAATASLETMTGLIQSVERPGMTDYDRHYLKLATAYQTAFMIENPDIFMREDVTSTSQDGESANYRNPDSHILAPLARKALRRLSWRTLRAVVPGGGTPSRQHRDVNSEAFDDRLPYSAV
jgi:hypothetical protein